MPEKGLRKWIITLTVVFATLMQLLDSTVVNVALPHMMGNLGVSFEDVGWVVTSYAIAIIIILPLSGWIGERLGRKNYFVASIILFTVFSFFCGNANSLGELIVFRFLQGLAGGGMAPIAQAILIEAWPAEELGMAMAMFGMGVVLGPLIGPVLGGYITDNFSWRWCFYINIPMCALATFMITTFIKPTPRQRAKSVDWLGLILLAIAVFSLQVVLERGEQEGWFSKHYILILAILAVFGWIGFIWRETTTENPVVDLSIFRHRSFMWGNITIMLYGVGLFGSVFVYPLLFQNLLGFTAEQTGIVTIPSAFVTIAMMPVVGRLLKRGIPAQILSATGISIFIVFCYLMSKTTLEFGMDNYFWPLAIRGLGLSMVFVPITTLAMKDLRGLEIGRGTGLNNMVQQLGGSFGIAFITTFVDRRVAYHRDVLMTNLNPYNNAFQEHLQAITQGIAGHGFYPGEAHQMALGAIQGSMMQQSLLMSYNDVFLAVGVFFVVMIPMILFQRVKIRRSKLAAA